MSFEVRVVHLETLMCAFRHLICMGPSAFLKPEYNRLFPHSSYPGNIIPTNEVMHAMPSFFYVIDMRPYGYVGYSS